MFILIHCTKYLKIYLILEKYVTQIITSHFSAISRMDNDLSAEWVGSIEETDERALQWFAINLMTHNLHNKGLVPGTAVIVSIHDNTPDIMGYISIV